MNNNNALECAIMGCPKGILHRVTCFEIEGDKVIYWDTCSICGRSVTKKHEMKLELFRRSPLPQIF